MTTEPQPSQTAATSDFDVQEQFKKSIIKVTSVAKEEQEEQKSLQPTKPVVMPNMAYLQNKRGSVFQKNVDLKSVADFKAPVFQKEE